MSLQTIDLTRLALQPGETVLDLGCGEGRHSILAYLEAPITVVGLDLSSPDLATTKQRFSEFEDAQDNTRSLNLIQGSGLTLPFADHRFDVVICSEVLEHIPEFERVLAEIRRVLKPGGRISVSVPRFFPEWICWKLSDAYHEVPGGHVRIFRTSQLTQAVEKQNFKLIKRHWAHSLHVPYWWLKCLFWESGDKNWAVRTYHRLLVWDLMRGPWITRALDRLLNPLIGKSVVLYFDDGANA